jgi:ribosomal protein S30
VESNFPERVEKLREERVLEASREYKKRINKAASKNHNNAE